MAQVKTHSPVYISYLSLQSGMEKIAPNGKPPARVDKSLLSGMSGSGKAQFLGALKYLGVIDDNGYPKAGLDSLCDKSKWKSSLASLLKAKYPNQLSVLANGTPSQFVESFGDIGGIRTPAARFLLTAAKDVGLQVSDNIKEIGAPKKSRVKQTKEPKPSGGDERQDDDRLPDAGNDFRSKLLGKFPEFDPKWDAETQKAWFAGMGQMMSLLKTEGGES